MYCIIEDIENYLFYLTKNVGLRVSLHPQVPEDIIMTTSLRCYNMHHNSYCIQLKQIDGIQKECIACQKKVFEQCQYGSFCGTCHAGVFEYVYPIKTSQKLIGFISVSGYRSDMAEDKLYFLSAIHNVPPAYLHEIYESLEETIPPKDFIDTLLAPLQRMLELAYEKRISNDLPSDFFQDVMSFIRLHYTEPLTAEVICRHFSCSRSCLSHQFKNRCGLSLREYITTLRMEDAKSLLLHSNLNVTEIAIAVGFSDSNYFSKAFKKATGLSPANYRKGQ